MKEEFHRPQRRERHQANGSESQKTNDRQPHLPEKSLDFRRLKGLKRAVDHAPMTADCRIVVNIPARCTEESLKQTLSYYSKPEILEGIDPSKIEINVLVNGRQTDSPHDSIAAQDVRQFQDEHPELKVNLLTTTYDQPVISRIRRDIAQVSLMRAADAQVDLDKLVIITHDADLVDLPARYFRNVLDEFDNNPKLGCLQAPVDYPSNEIAEDPALQIVQRFNDTYDTISRHKERYIPLKQQNNSAYRASAYLNAGGHSKDRRVTEDKELVKSLQKTGGEAVKFSASRKVKSIYSARRQRAAKQSGVLQSDRYHTFGTEKDLSAKFGVLEDETKMSDYDNTVQSVDRELKAFYGMQISNTYKYISRSKSTRGLSLEAMVAYLEANSPHTLDALHRRIQRSGYYVGVELNFKHGSLNVASVFSDKVIMSVLENLGDSVDRDSAIEQLTRISNSPKFISKAMDLLERTSQPKADDEKSATDLNSDLLQQLLTSAPILSTPSETNFGVPSRLPNKGVVVAPRTKQPEVQHDPPAPFSLADALQNVRDRISDFVRSRDRETAVQAPEDRFREELQASGRSIEDAFDAALRVAIQRQLNQPGLNLEEMFRDISRQLNDLTRGRIFAEGVAPHMVPGAENERGVWYTQHGAIRFNGTGQPGVQLPEIEGHENLRSLFNVLAEINLVDMLALAAQHGIQLTNVTFKGRPPKIALSGGQVDIQEIEAIIKSRLAKLADTFNHLPDDVKARLSDVSLRNIQVTADPEVIRAVAIHNDPAARRQQALRLPPDVSQTLRTHVEEFVSKQGQNPFHHDDEGNTVVRPVNGMNDTDYTTWMRVANEIVLAALTQKDPSIVVDLGNGVVRPVALGGGSIRITDNPAAPPIILTDEVLTGVLQNPFVPTDPDSLINPGLMTVVGAVLPENGSRDGLPDLKDVWAAARERVRVEEVSQSAFELMPRLDPDKHYNPNNNYGDRREPAAAGNGGGSRGSGRGNGRGNGNGMPPYDSGHGSLFPDWRKLLEGLTGAAVDGIINAPRQQFEDDDEPEVRPSTDSGKSGKHRGWGGRLLGAIGDAINQFKGEWDEQSYTPEEEKERIEARDEADRRGYAEREAARKARAAEKAEREAEGQAEREKWRAERSAERERDEDRHLERDYGLTPDQVQNVHALAAYLTNGDFHAMMDKLRKGHSEDSSPDSSDKSPSNTSDSGESTSESSQNPGNNGNGYARHGVLMPVRDELPKDNNAQENISNIPDPEPDNDFRDDRPPATDHRRTSSDQRYGRYNPYIPDPDPVEEPERESRPGAQVPKKEADKSAVPPLPRIVRPPVENTNEGAMTQAPGGRVDNNMPDMSRLLRPIQESPKEVPPAPESEPELIAPPNGLDQWRHAAQLWRAAAEQLSQTEGADLSEDQRQAFMEGMNALQRAANDPNSQFDPELVDRVNRSLGITEETRWTLENEQKQQDGGDYDKTQDKNPFTRQDARSAPRNTRLYDPGEKNNKPQDPEPPFWPPSSDNKS